MFNKIRHIIYDIRRREDEYKIVYQVLERANLHTCSYPYAIYPMYKRSDNYNELKKLPGIISKLQSENKELETQIQRYKEQLDNTSHVIDTILDTVEKRYALKKQDEHET